MHETQWRRVEELYHLALEQSAGERAAFLDKECAGDSGLKREVETLLESANGVPEFLLCPDRQPDLRPGAMLGPYRLAGWIGSGGMGEVWKARDTRLNRDVAIKVAKIEFTARFAREARAVAALNHPHICQIYDVGSNYLVVEFVDGHPLKGPLPLGRALPLAIQFADALDAAHQKGVVHCDLKPANVIETRSGIKVLDFGLARLQSAEPLVAEVQTVPDTAATREGFILGTPHYMAPEQIQGKTADARTDIFAFGCVLYEMLTGKRAFSGDGPAAILAAILERPSPSIAGIAPAALDQVLKRCLAKDPQERWQNAGDLKAAVVIAAESQPPEPSTRRQWIGAAAIGAAGILGGSTLSWLRRSPRSADALRVEIDPPAGGRFGTQPFGRNFALSPDGRNAVYTAWQGEKTGLWLRSLNGAPPRMISETDSTTRPFWSPDSQSFAFSNGVKILRADATGGAVWSVCDIPSPIEFDGGAWTFDGQIVYALLGDGLFRVSASGGTPVRLTTPDRSRSERTHARPQVLPHGRFFYLAVTDVPASSVSYAAPLARPSDRVRMMSTPTEALYAPGGDGKDYLIWQRDGTLVAQEFDTESLKPRGEAHLIASPVITRHEETAATASSNGLLLYSAVNSLTTQLIWVDRQGESAGVLGDPSEYFTFRISADGRHIAAGRTRSGEENELWIVESPRGAAVRVGKIASPSLCIWSPNGRALVHTAVRTRNLIRQNVSGTGEARELTQASPPHVHMPSDWSMDGRFIIYMESSPGESLNLMAMEIRADGGVVENRPWLATPFTETDAVFIPQSPARWVAYMSNESGRFEIYVDSFPERRGKTRISIDGGRFPKWGSGGRELFFMSQDHKLMVVDVRATSDSISCSAPRELFAMRIVENAFPPYDVTRDGRHFLVRSAVPTSEPLTLIINWPALMKGQVPR